MKKNTIQLFWLAIVTILFLLVSYYKIPEWKAKEYYNPIETIAICEENFIGTEYREDLEPLCSLLWEKFTYELVGDKSFIY
jgi:hypothetical protein